MDKKIYELTNYTSDAQCIIGKYIYEYDIKHANISILYNAGILSKDKYDWLSSIDKKDREILIGKLMEKNNSEDAIRISTILENGFKEARRNLIERNNIPDYNIIMTRKDSLLLVNTIPTYTKFGEVEFINKNTYTVYINIGIGNIYLFYGKRNISFMNDEYILVIKGISKELQKLHEMYFISILHNICQLLETGSVTDAIFYLRKIMRLYREKKLPIEYYREFNSSSLYRVPVNVHNIENIYGINTIDCYSIDNIDIGYNYEVLVHLYQIIMNLYLS